MVPDAARARVTSDSSRPERLSDDARVALRNGGDEALADEMRIARSDDPAFFGSDGFGFDDFLDIVNPLQHLPVVSHLYRAITGDQIEHGARLIGGAVFGGPVGFGSALGNVILKDHSGRDVGEHVTAFLIEDSPESDEPGIDDPEFDSTDSGPTVLAGGASWSASDESTETLPPFAAGPVSAATLGPPSVAAAQVDGNQTTARLTSATLDTKSQEPSDAEIFSSFSAPPRRRVAPETARLLDALAENQAAPSTLDRVLLAADRFTSGATRANTTAVGAATTPARLPDRMDGTPTMENPFVAYQTSGRRVDIATSPLVEEAIQIAKSNYSRSAGRIESVDVEQPAGIETARADLAPEPSMSAAASGAIATANPAVVAQAARAYAASAAATASSAERPVQPARSIATAQAIPQSGQNAQTTRPGLAAAPLHAIPDAMISALERYDALKAEAG